jgi:hypothetical protein
MEEFNSRLAKALENTRTALETNELVLQAVSQQSQQIANLQSTKADWREVRRLEAELADLQAEQQRLAHNRDHLTVVSFESLLRTKFGDRIEVGKHLSRISKELAICKIDRPDDRFGTVGAYHPFVCRVYCEKNNIPLPPLLKYAMDPR